uniref:Uncharacterized protein n=1 Tax=Timema bartmani TaxID=61472 RepID=A0A7R9FB36_9NEOP|nr:unnamed protein product [Timema bartmani]
MESTQHSQPSLNTAEMDCRLTVVHFGDLLLFIASLLDEVFHIIELEPQLFASALALKFFFHFFLPLFIAGLLLLPDYIGIVEDAPNCDVIVCCYVLLIHVVLG